MSIEFELFFLTGQLRGYELVFCYADKAVGFLLLTFDSNGNCT